MAGDSIQQSLPQTLLNYHTTTALTEWEWQR